MRMWSSSVTQKWARFNGQRMCHACRLSMPVMVSVNIRHKRCWTFSPFEKKLEHSTTWPFVISCPVEAFLRHFFRPSRLHWSVIWNMVEQFIPWRNCWLSTVTVSSNLVDSLVQSRFHPFSLFRIHRIALRLSTGTGNAQGNYGYCCCGRHSTSNARNRIDRSVSERNRLLLQTHHTSLEEILPDTDVLYMTRIQRERFASDEEYKKVSVRREANGLCIDNSPVCRSMASTKSRHD